MDRHRFTLAIEEAGFWRRSMKPSLQCAEAPRRCLYTCKRCNLRARHRSPAWSGASVRATSESGRVSRAWPVHTAARNCTRDEGRPFGFGDQVADPKPPQAAVVKSDGGERCGNAGTRFRQARLREASASEPLMRCRKPIRRCRNRGVPLPPGSARENPEALPERHPACRRREAQPGSCTERENLSLRCQGRLASALVVENRG